MKVEDAINLLDTIWKQVPLMHEVNLKAQEAINILRAELLKKEHKVEK